MKTFSIALIAFLLFFLLPLSFNLWLNAGCRAGSGIITTHGKTCAL